MSGMQPSLCLVKKPTGQSVLFAGQYINLHQLAADTGYDRSYLSRVFSGKRQPSLKAAALLASALAMSMDGFVSALESLLPDSQVA